MELIEIGKIVNTFGIKGELKVVSESDFIDYRFRKGATIYLKIGKNYKEVKVSSLRIIKGNPCITIDNMMDINMIEMYVGAGIYADKNDKPVLKDGEYMIDDLIDKNVYDENHNLIGTVNDFIIIPVNKIMEIKLNNGEMKLIPFIKEFILDVNDEGIVIRNLEVENAEEI